MHEDVMFTIIKRSAESDGFRRRLAADLDSTLQTEGYRLTHEETAAARDFFARFGRLDDHQLRAAIDETGMDGAV